MELALVFLAGFAIGALIALLWTTSKLRSQFSSHIVEAGENLKAAEAIAADLFHKQEELRNDLEAKIQGLILVREQLDVAQSKLKQAQASLEELSSVRDRLDAEIRLRVPAETKLENPEINLKQQEKLLDEATARLADTFASLSAEAPKSNNQGFLTLAKSTLETIHA
jgi:DNA recombination protein RmuC